MFTRRSITLLILMIVPLLAYIGLGAYALWQTDLFLQTFWILPAFWLLTWAVATIWPPPRRSHVVPPLPHPRHLTSRDEAALEIVQRYQRQVDDLNPELLTDYQFYVDKGVALAQELARHYHPHSTDPVSSLTVLEVLAAVRLAVDDIERWLLESVPGSQLVTIRQWRWLRHAPKWVRRIQNTAWAAGMLINPANVVKYFTSQMTMGPVAEEVQTELLAAIYLRFIRQVGFYLVEMNSGRLRGGADKYRATFGSEADGGLALRRPSATLTPEPLTVAIIGQVKAGKSSLINALVGDSVAKTDVLPETQAVSRYSLQIPEAEGPLTLLDTPGYADSGASARQLREMQQALHGADVALFVMDAHSPARDADRRTLNELQSWLQKQPSLRRPPIIICLTHIDLLSPMLEWKPPYNWSSPRTPKEHSIHNAVQYVRELFPEAQGRVVPVCADPRRGQVSRVLEELVPPLLQVLSDGQMASLLRTYHEQLDRDRWQAVLRQLQNSGKNLLRIWVEERLMNRVEPE